MGHLMGGYCTTDFEKCLPYYPSILYIYTSLSHSLRMRLLGLSSMGRFLARILVLALVVMVACTSPVAALGVDLNTTTPAIPEAVTGAGTPDASNGRVLVAPFLLGAAVIEGGEALALILSGGVIAGIAVAQPNPNDNIFKCLDEMRQKIEGFFADVLKDPSGHKTTTIDGHTVDIYTERHNWFQGLQTRFSYGESKRQGIPVKDHHEDLDNFHEMPNDGLAYSSKSLFACQLDKDNGCLVEDDEDEEKQNRN